MGHFRIKKTYKVVYEHFYWPSLMKDVERICNRCVVCKKAKSKVKNQGKDECQVSEDSHEG